MEEIDNVVATCVVLDEMMERGNDHEAYVYYDREVIQAIDELELALDAMQLRRMLGDGS